MPRVQQQREGIDKHFELDEIKNGLKQLEEQQSRIVENIGKGGTPGVPISLINDADFYFIVLNRMYQTLNHLASGDSRVANLKGKHMDLYENIKIRHHYEHWPGWENFSPLFPNSVIKAKGCFLRNGDKISIMSGTCTWSFPEDHERFVGIINELCELYPFENNFPKPNTLKKLKKHLKICLRLITSK